MIIRWIDSWFGSGSNIEESDVTNLPEPQPDVSEITSTMQSPASCSSSSSPEPTNDELPALPPQEQPAISDADTHEELTISDADKEQAHSDEDKEAIPAVEEPAASGEAEAEDDVFLPEDQERLTESFNLITSRDTLYDDSVISRVSAKLALSKDVKKRSSIQPEVLAIAEIFQQAYFNHRLLQEKQIRNGVLKIKLLMVHTGIWQGLPGRVNRHVAQIVDAQFGLMHTGLQIGPWIIEWNSSSLVIPREIRSRAPLLLADIGTLNVEMHPERLQLMCEKIVEWNVTHTYDRLNANCQIFVADMLSCLGLEKSIDSSSPLGEFLTDIRRTGTSTMTFHNPVWPETVQFRTHKELDEYTIRLKKRLKKERNESFKHNYPQHHTLLKSFDRAFWLMYMDAKMRNEKPPPDECKPIEEFTNHKSTCPFHRPDVTQSVPRYMFIKS